MTGNTPGTHFCQRLSRPQGHSVTGRIMSLEKIPVTPSGIKPTTCRFVAQCRNHYATARPLKGLMSCEILPCMYLRLLKSPFKSSNKFVYLFVVSSSCAACPAHCSRSKYSAEHPFLLQPQSCVVFLRVRNQVSHLHKMTDKPEVLIFRWGMELHKILN